jgi:hypothetical protein
MFKAEGVAAAGHCISFCSKSIRIAPNNFARAIEALCRSIQGKKYENLFERFSIQYVKSSFM